MASTVSLRQMSYENSSRLDIKPAKDQTIINVVDDIVEYITLNKQQLIVDIENEVTQRKELDTFILKYLQDKNITVRDAKSYEGIVSAVASFMWGYDFVDKYIDDRDISDIAVKGLKDISIKKNGIRYYTDIELPSMRRLINFARTTAVKCGGNLSRRDALAVLSDTKSSKFFNLRINIGLDPVNTVSPHVAFRKIPKWIIKPDMKKLQEQGMFDTEEGEYISKAFEKGLNILIVGHGGSGKTTLLNAGIEMIPENMSKLCIQESEELSSGKRGWIFQNVVMKHGESDIEYTLMQLATNGLLLDLDWFIIGESKGAESMALYEACYTDHKVALTAHAPSAKAGIDRVILNMKKSGTDYSRQDLLRMLSNLDVIIYMSKYKVREITEITGYDESLNDLALRPIYHMNSDGVYIRDNDSCPRVLRKLREG